VTVILDYYARWRREWDSNPRYAFTHTRFPSVRLKPLGHPSVPGAENSSPDAPGKPRSPRGPPVRGPPSALHWMSCHNRPSVGRAGLLTRCPGHRCRDFDTPLPAFVDRRATTVTHRWSVASATVMRPSSAPPGTPTAVSPPCRTGACASCPPSASPAACACG
jgi:hypothetical protein